MNLLVLVLVIEVQGQADLSRADAVAKQLSTGYSEVKRLYN